MKKQIYLLLMVLCLGLIAHAQKVKEPTNIDSDWIKNFEPFRIAGNLFYVGTYDLACYLITGSEGHILVNTGLASSASQIKKNIEQLGFTFKDIKILLTTQAHYDHMGAMADIKKETGAKFYVNTADKETAETGGKSDYEMGKYGVTFKPIKADKLLNDGDNIKLGNILLTMLHHPGHTKGSCSYLFTTQDSSRSFNILIANMPTIISDRKFEEITDYPGISKDFGNTLQSMKKLDFDIWVASHAGQFELHEKRKPGAAYNPALFSDKNNFDEYLSKLQEAYNKKLKEDKVK
jgi:glyoxylase-like metal-dependent hydrolase (beta-lactamase superfamily II)